MGGGEWDNGDREPAAYGGLAAAAVGVISGGIEIVERGSGRDHGQHRDSGGLWLMVRAQMD